MRSLRPLWLLAVCCLGIAATPSRAQISPECAGVRRPADYDEAKQQAHLANYFAAGFLLTPLGSPSRDPGQTSMGLELGAIPPLSCDERLALDATKTEDTNKSPVLPRGRVMFTSRKVGPIVPWGGFAFVPPVPSPLGTVFIADGELGATWPVQLSPDRTLDIGGRAHLGFARVRSEIASAPKGQPVVEDIFFTSSLGADVSVGSRFTLHPEVVLAPYLFGGVADVSTLVIVGDDLAVVQNTQYPWAGALVGAGAELRAWSWLVLGIEASAAVPVFPTAKLFVGVQF
jgi:hypothetical protein